MKNFLRWTAPLLFTVAGHTLFRLASPTLREGTVFWAGGKIHLYEILLSLPAAYLMDYLFRQCIRKRVDRPQTVKNIFSEYALLFLWLWLFLEIVVVALHTVLSIPIRLSHLIHDPAVFTPLCMLYYLLLRNQSMQRKNTIGSAVCDPRSAEPVGRTDSLPAETAGDSRPDHLFVKSGRQFKKIPMDEIVFIKSMENYIVIQTAAAKETVYMTLKQVSESLPAIHFLRTHRSYIVNLRKIETVEGNRLTAGGFRIPISRNFKIETMQRILDKKFIDRA